MVTVEKQDILGTKCYRVQAVMSDEMLNEIIGSNLEINHTVGGCTVGRPADGGFFKLTIKIIHINYCAKTKNS